MKIQTSNNLIQDSAKIIQSWLMQQSNKTNKFVLLASGGSSLKVYEHIADNLPADLDLTNFTLTLIDERYGPMNHSDSNGKQLESTGLIEEVKKRGGNWQPLLTGLSMSDEASRMDHWFKSLADNQVTCFGQLGVGEDGHIAGILPTENQNQFIKQFPNDRFYISYTVDDNYPNPHKQRITITPAGLKHLTNSILFATANKKPVIDKLLAEQEKSIYNFPLELVKEFNTKIFLEKR